VAGGDVVVTDGLAGGGVISPRLGGWKKWLVAGCVVVVLLGVSVGVWLAFGRGSGGGAAAKAAPSEKTVLSIAKSLSSGDADVVAGVLSERLRPHAAEIAVGALPAGAIVVADVGSMKVISDGLVSVKVDVGGVAYLEMLERFDGKWLLVDTTKFEDWMQ